MLVILTDVDGVELVFFFKQKTAYEMRISDWSSDVCSSDLDSPRFLAQLLNQVLAQSGDDLNRQRVLDFGAGNGMMGEELARYGVSRLVGADISAAAEAALRSEEHTSELQSLMRTSYAVFCLKKKITQRHISDTRRLSTH